MEEILLIEEEEEIFPEALFPRLECLFLEDLPILKSFCIERNAKFPLLKTISMKNCPKLKTFAFRHASANMDVRKGLMETNLEENPDHITLQSPTDEAVYIF